MKNRKLLYILLPAVVIIWGLILVKVLSWMNGDKQEQAISVSLPPGRGSNAVPDTFSLQLNYADPFTLQPVFRGSEQYPGTVVKAVIKWPDVMHFGTLTTGKHRTQFATLQINGVVRLMKPGDTCCGIQLMKVKCNAVVLRYHGSERTISRESEK